LETTDPNELDREYDVIVAGGGSAAIAAAITSAREGLKTLLFTKLPSIG
jgi:succinate dehydrogenase/fumarate reductase flavoprotein subunit